MMHQAASSCELTPGGWWLHRTAIVDSTAVIYPGAFIGPNVTIAAGCVIGPNASIGQPGFGYELTTDHRHEYRPHNEGVILSRDVHVGANTCIDQGRHRPTTIGEGTKIDNLVHIAHNVTVGRHCLIIAHVMLAGSVTVGDYSHVAPGALVRDWREVGEHTTVGLGAVVVKDVMDGETVAGNPARPL